MHSYIYGVWADYGPAADFVLIMLCTEKQVAERKIKSYQHLNDITVKKDQGPRIRYFMTEELLLTGADDHV